MSILALILSLVSLIRTGRNHRDVSRLVDTVAHIEESIRVNDQAFVDACKSFTESIEKLDYALVMLERYTLPSGSSSLIVTGPRSKVTTTDSESNMSVSDSRNQSSDKKSKNKN
ncbi:hypothetical protein [Capybara microvirus Cap1_SP_116]|nr:hypothetical protein [Capybara microvirus Cap1_SP_116]